MSAPAEPELGVTLDAYAARVRASAASGSGRQWREWVLVDEDERVLEVFAWPEPAIEDVNARFDLDPAVVGSLRLVVLDNGRPSFDAWPRGGTPLERAGALATEMSGHELCDGDVLDWTRQHFLRGELGWTQIAGEKRRSVELWWYARDGEHDPVGLLVERSEEQAWQLLLDGRARGLEESQLHRRIAQVMTALGDERWTEELIALTAADLARGRAPTDRLGPAGLCVEAQLLLARELHVMEPLGRVWP
jgi:hypothetical protein